MISSCVEIESFDHRSTRFASKEFCSQQAGVGLVLQVEEPGGRIMVQALLHRFRKPEETCGRRGCLQSCLRILYDMLTTEPCDKYLLCSVFVCRLTWSAHSSAIPCCRSTTLCCAVQRRSRAPSSPVTSSSPSMASACRCAWRSSPARIPRSYRSSQSTRAPSRLTVACAPGAGQERRRSGAAAHRPARIQGAPAPIIPPRAASPPRAVRPPRVRPAAARRRAARGARAGRGRAGRGGRR